MSNPTGTPVHGQLGDLNTYERFDQNVHTRCVSRLRWCEVCGEWVGGKGIVSMVVAAVGCTKCMTPWDRPAPAAAGTDDDDCPF